MRCTAPLPAWRRKSRSGVTLKYSEGDTRFPLWLPCGGCLACLRTRARQHAVRCVHEAECHERSCFVTLTYDDAHLPYGCSLVKEHLSQFMRDLRKEVGYGVVRFFACGEYGELGGRPHYHALVFGCDFAADRRVVARRRGVEAYRSDFLERVWSRGRAELGRVGFASAAYVAGYVAKKLGESALVGREPEFVLMSNRPGVGIPWIERNYAHVYARDSVVLDGFEYAPPRAYDKWLADKHPGVWRVVRERRHALRLQSLRERADVGVMSDREVRKFGRVEDERDVRLAAQDEVLRARVNLFKRELAL